MTYPTFQIELKYLEKYKLVAGVDEVGRGPLAGPVVAAAVILDPEKAGKKRSGLKWWGKIRDSKLLAAKQRQELAEIIKANCLGFGIAAVEAEEIDRLNIHNAALLAMREAVKKCELAPQCLLVDGLFKIKSFAGEQIAIVKGDVKILSIAAASIIAKVHRDNLMTEMHAVYPQYGFDKHKGYPTAMHKKMLNRYGPCPIHRRSFLKTIDL